MAASERKAISQISKTISTPSSKKVVEIDALAKDINNQLASAKKDSILKKPRSFLNDFPNITIKKAFKHYLLNDN